MEKNFLKDKEKAIKELNQLVSSHGNLKDLAESVDTVLLDHLQLLMSHNEGGGEWVTTLIWNLRGVRDFLNKIEHN